MIGRDRHPGVIAAGRIHQDSGRSEHIDDLLMGRLETSPVTRVGTEEMSPSAGIRNRLNPGIPTLRVASKDRDFGTGRSESVRQRAAEHAGGADYNGNFFREIKKRSHGAQSTAKTKPFGKVYPLSARQARHHPRKRHWVPFRLPMPPNGTTPSRHRREGTGIGRIILRDRPYLRPSPFPNGDGESAPKAKREFCPQEDQ